MRHTSKWLAIAEAARCSGIGRRATWRRIALGLTLLIVPGCSISDSLRSTCAPYEAMKRRNMSKWVATREAQRIWRDCYASKYEAQPCGEDVREGFVLAYVETALGGNGCPPPIPVSPVLSRHTLTHTFPNGNQWFYGYQLGHANALSNGVDRRRFAPLNPELMCIPPQVGTVACVGTEPTPPCQSTLLDPGMMSDEYLTESEVYDEAVVGSAIQPKATPISPLTSDAGSHEASSVAKPSTDVSVPAKLVPRTPSPSDSTLIEMDGEFGLVPQALSDARREVRPVVIDHPTIMN